jgi:FKBP-type peptidyl-prolyl cis-trans isomerase
MKQNILIGVLIIAIFATLGVVVNGTDFSGEETRKDVEEVAQKTPSDAKVGIEEMVEGTGEAVKSGDTVVVHYLGTLPDGTKFDSSYDRNEPFETPIGSGAVIQGWDQGIPGMKVGGKRKLTIPAELGYGERGTGTIPPNSPLIFEVELLEIK